MKINFKSSILFFCALLMSALSFAQTPGEDFTHQLLDEEGVEYGEMNLNDKMNKAASILDERKEKGLLTEKDFQNQLGLVMQVRTVIRKNAYDERVRLSKKNREEYLAKKAAGEIPDVFDVRVMSLDKKLKAGKISQAEYNYRVKDIREKQAKAKKEN